MRSGHLQVGPRPAQHAAGLGDHTGSRQAWAGPGHFCRPFSCPGDPIAVRGVVSPSILRPRRGFPETPRYSLSSADSLRLVSGVSAPTGRLLRAEAVSPASSSRNGAGVLALPGEQPCSLGACPWPLPPRSLVCGHSAWPLQVRNRVGVGAAVELFPVELVISGVCRAAALTAGLLIGNARRPQGGTEEPLGARLEQACGVGVAPGGTPACGLRGVWVEQGGWQWCRAWPGCGTRCPGRCPLRPRGCAGAPGMQSWPGMAQPCPERGARLPAEGGGLSQARLGAGPGQGGPGAEGPRGRFLRRGTFSTDEFHAHGKQRTTVPHCRGSRASPRPLTAQRP